MGVSWSLPTTAYIKMLDIWMIFCILYPFLIVILHTLSELLTQDQSKVRSLAAVKERACQLGKVFVLLILRWGLPLLSCCFISTFWALGISNYFWPQVTQFCRV